jgi:hypothetical protein
MDKNEKISKSMKFNTNAEKWSEELAIEFMTKAVELSKSKEYDFIGEIAKDLDSYKDVFFYLSDKYPVIKRYVKRMRNNCEANCFNNIKKENINVGAGIMNLKSNHGWTDRVQQDHVTQGEKIQTQFIVGTKELGDELKGFIEDIGKDI